MSKRALHSPPPPLLPAGALWLLVGASLTLLLALWPVARGRLHSALAVAPSSLSISYLELSLLQHPDDAQLRLALVRKLVESGQLVAARSHLLPLLAADSAPRRVAQWQLLEIDRASWAAIAPAATAARASALAVVLSDLAALQATGLPLAELERVAELQRELAQPLLAAEILDTLARRGLPDAEARVAAADAAWLAADRADRAAELQAYAATPGSEGALAHARLAIERVRGTGDLEATWAMSQSMCALHPDDLPLLEYAAQVAEGSDVERALQLTAELSRRQPNEPTYHRTLARLSEATGRSLRALDEYVWLVRHGGDERDRARAIGLAKANWDLPLVRELLEHKPRASEPTKPVRRGKPRCQAAGRPMPRVGAVRALRERVALDEALGDAAAARAKLTAALSGELANSPVLWQHKYDLERAQGDDRAALATALVILERFEPTDSARERVAALQLALGDGRAALHTLLGAPAPDKAQLQRLARLAFENDDVTTERAVYGQLVALPDVQPWEYQRYWELAPDRTSALAIALRGFERFESSAMLYAALALYEREGRELERMRLLETAERSAVVRARPEYWSLRIGLHQRLAAQSERTKDYAQAKRQLQLSAALLARAPQLTASAKSQLLTSQHAQELSLGLASEDRALIARAYVDYHERLTVPERVYVLQRLGRDDEALLVARSALTRTDLAPRDRAGLLTTAQALSADIERYTRVTGGAVQMDGLNTFDVGAAVSYGDRAARLRGEASFTQYRARSGVNVGIADEVHDVAAALSGRLARVALEAGARVRDERSIRPYGGLGWQIAGKPSAGFGVQLRANDSATDTARLRALGVRDALQLDLAVPFSEHLYMSVRGIAEAYYARRDRQLLGAGLSLDAGLGANVALPGPLGSAGVRLVGRVAPRFARDAALVDTTAPWLAESSQWAGLGASVGRGNLSAPPLLGRAFCYVLDGAAGWLWPQAGVGFTASAGLGFSVFGADLLTLAARGGNVVGSSVWSANVGYGLSIDR